MQIKTAKLKIGELKENRYSLYYNRVQLQNGWLYHEGEKYRVNVGYADVDGLEFNGEKKEGIQLIRDEDGISWVLMDDIIIDIHNGGNGKSFAWVKNKTSFTLYDNRSRVFSGWYANTHSRKSAFKMAIEYLRYRVMSGNPTKKPYILYIQEDPNQYGKTPKRQWEIRIEIVRTK